MNWVASMLQDGANGSVSSKRVVTLAAFLLCAVAFVANMFFGYKIDQFIFESMSYIAMAGLGVTVAEKFASRGTTQTPPQHVAQLQPTYTTTVTRVHGTPLPYQEDPLV